MKYMICIYYLYHQKYAIGRKTWIVRHQVLVKQGLKRLLHYCLQQRFVLTLHGGSCFGDIKIEERKWDTPGFTFLPLVNRCYTVKKSDRTTIREDVKALRRIVSDESHSFAEISTGRGMWSITPDQLEPITDGGVAGDMVKYFKLPCDHSICLRSDEPVEADSRFHVGLMCVFEHQSRNR